MGNTVSKSIYGNNYFLSLNFKGLENVDHVSFLLVFGFVAIHCKQNKTNIPYNITCSVLLFYYNETNLYCVIKSFDKNGYDKTKWSLSNNNSTITGIHKKGNIYDDRFCIYCSNQSITNISFIAIKYINNNNFDMKAKCSIGVTSEYNKKWISNTQSLWPRKGTYSRLDAERHWQSSNVLVLKLDTLNLQVTYYKQSHNKSLILIKQDILQANLKYYIMLCAAACKGQTFSIQPCNEADF